jgi:hypothetical protein
MQFHAERKRSLLREGYYDYRYQYIELFPIVTPSKMMEVAITNMVDNILELNKNLKKVENLSDKGKRIKEEIKRIEREIDQKVYELYELTLEEIKLIESKSQQVTNTD